MITLKKTFGAFICCAIGFSAFSAVAQTVPQSDGQPAFRMEQPLIAKDGGPTAQAVVPAGKMELFNGKDFSGWTFCLRTNAEPAKTFSVSNGLMHCTGQPFGYTRTEKNFRDYKLTVEWRFVKVAPKADNSGVFIHVQPPDNVWPKCIECQGQFQRQGDLILMEGATSKGHDTQATRGARSTAERNEKPAGEWNTYQVEASGDNLKVFVNGRLMNEATECNLRSGAIAIQSEGGEWEVRKVTIEPLAAK
jgi:hypothetical protein